MPRPRKDIKSPQQVDEPKETEKKSRAPKKNQLKDRYVNNVYEKVPIPIPAKRSKKYQYLYIGPYNELGEREGNGEAWYDNGDYFKGQFKRNKRNGYGFYIFNENFLGHYIGFFKDGLRDHMGVFFTNDAGIYYGQWKDNWRHGVGEYYYKDFDYFKGKWENDKKHGKGFYYHHELKALYIGKWIEGKRQPNGDLSHNTTFVPPERPTTNNMLNAFKKEGWELH